MLRILNQTVLHRPLSETVGAHAWDNDWYQYNLCHDYVGYKLMQDIGLKYVRTGIMLKSVQTGPNEYDFSGIEGYLIGCEKYGLQPLVYFQAGSPTWRGELSYTDALADDYEIALACIKHFARRGIIWEACNEAGYQNFWFGKNSYKESGATVTLDKQTISDWVNLNRFIGKMVKKHDPTGQFVNGATATGFKNTHDHYNAWGTMMDYAGSLGAFETGDLNSQHPYAEYLMPEVWLKNVSDPHSQLLQMQGLMEKYHNYLPQIVTEQGFKTDISGTSGQANLIARSILVLDMLNVPIDIIFNFAAAKNYEGWALVDGPDNDLAERASAKMLASLLSTLKGTTLAHFDTKDDSSYTLFYQGLSGKYIVYWTTATAHSDSYNGVTLNLTATPQVIKLNGTWQFYDNYDNIQQVIHDLNECASLTHGALIDIVNRLHDWVKPYRVPDLTPISTGNYNRQAYYQIGVLIQELEFQFNGVVDYLNAGGVHGKKTYIRPQRVKLNVPEGLQFSHDYIEVLKGNNRRLTDRIVILQKILKENGLLP
ncbi:hypothetical protein AYR56_05425 [Loigolactobacillus backii]|uniref:hypothetical protein n=1 Tax=Loigolactobacillus backii TaxID=375175 RepID=UPI0007F09579|nr:hypothetical protein [Loigolactobacillus backii]ANK69641.1 hypothetical protein AYR56_05425 [Loigolactobacillus backii]